MKLRLIRFEPLVRPGQHVIEVAADATGGIGGDGRYRRAVPAQNHVATVVLLMRLRHVADGIAIPFTDLAARQPQWREHLAMHQRFVRRAARSGGHLAGHHVKQVVVLVL